jgi:hypothetical protein
MGGGWRFFLCWQIFKDSDSIAIRPDDFIPGFMNEDLSPHSILEKKTSQYRVAQSMMF